MKNRISILILILIVSFSNAQNPNELPVSILKGDSLNVYNLLKKSIKLSAVDSTAIHFLPTITIYTKKNNVYFETYFYDTNIRNSWNSSSATNLGRLSFEKRHLPAKKEEATESFIVEETVHSEIIPSTYKFEVNAKRKNLFVEESTKPILNSSTSYYITATFYRRTYKNLVDPTLYTFINENSIDKSNYYFLCAKEYAILKIKDKFGFINKDNEVIMPFNKNKITYYKQGFLIEEDAVQYFYDPIKGKKVTKDYDKIIVNKIRFLDKSLLNIINGYHLVERNNSFNLLNYSNEEVFSTNYQDIKGLGENKKKQYVLLVKNNDNSFQLIDLYTQDIIRSEKFMQSAGGRIVVKKNNKYGVINIDNDFVLENKYDEILCQKGREHIVRLPVRLKDKWALYITHKSEFVTDFIYSSMSVAGEFMIVTKNNKYGIIDAQGTIKFPIKYDKIEFDPETSLYIVVKGETEELYNRMLRKKR